MAIIPGSAKVLNQYENVNTTYGGSKAMKAQSKWYTMQDVEDTINANKPYKVFTALLTQTGAGNELNKNSGDLIQGVTYNIDDNSGGADFTNVGAPNNNIGTKFIANANIEPNNYGTGNLTYNTGAPVATVLENTIGNVWFTYNTPGVYTAYMPPFPEQKQVVFSPTSAYKTSSNEAYINISNNSIDGEVNITTTNGTSKADNNTISDFPIEIRIYN